MAFHVLLLTGLLVVGVLTFKFCLVLVRPYERMVVEADDDLRVLEHGLHFLSPLRGKHRIDERTFVFELPVREIVQAAHENGVDRFPTSEARTRDGVAVDATVSGEVAVADAEQFVRNGRGQDSQQYAGHVVIGTFYEEIENWTWDEFADQTEDVAEACERSAATELTRSGLELEALEVDAVERVEAAQPA